MYLGICLLALPTPLRGQSAKAGVEFEFEFEFRFIRAGGLELSNGRTPPRNVEA